MLGTPIHWQARMTIIRMEGGSIDQTIIKMEGGSIDQSLCWCDYICFFAACILYTTLVHYFICTFRRRATGMVGPTQFSHYSTFNIRLADHSSRLHKHAYVVYL